MGLCHIISCSLNGLCPIIRCSLNEPECKEVIQMDRKYAGIYEYIFIDLEGTVKCKLKQPHNGKHFHVITSTEDFIKGTLEMVIINDRDSNLHDLYR